MDRNDDVVFGLGHAGLGGFKVKFSEFHAGYEGAALI